MHTYTHDSCTCTQNCQCRSAAWQSSPSWVPNLHQHSVSVWSRCSHETPAFSHRAHETCQCRQLNASAIRLSCTCGCKHTCHLRNPGRAHARRAHDRAWTPHSRVLHAACTCAGHVPCVWPCDSSVQEGSWHASSWLCEWLWPCDASVQAASWHASSWLWLCAWSCPWDSCLQSASLHSLECCSLSRCFTAAKVSSSK
jgi:hypothetical protein